jgi:CheY-like chemotaxis protein
MRMAVKILLIESDAAFAAEMSRALEARGLESRVSADGKEGLELARDLRPDAVVLCVELPRMSGYSICQKLKKDDALKSIPLILTSSEATPETFEAHRKLKARADDYLIKPFGPRALIDKLGALVELPAAGAGEELVTLDDVEELSGEIPLDGVSSARPAPAEDDADLKLLDSAFDSISGAEPAPRSAAEPGPSPGPEPAARPAAAQVGAGEDEAPVAGEDLRDAAALLPADDEAAHAEIDRLGEEADRALAALRADEPAEAAAMPGADEMLDEPPAAPPGDEPPVAEPPPALGGDIDARRLQARVSELLLEVARARDALEKRDAELASARQGSGGLEARLRGLEGAAAAREQAVRAAEEAGARAGREIEAARAEVRRATDARAEAEERARQADRRAAEGEQELSALRQRLEESERLASQQAAQAAEAASRAEALSQRVAAPRRSRVSPRACAPSWRRSARTSGSARRCLRRHPRGGTAPGGAAEAAPGPRGGERPPRGADREGLPEDQERREDAREDAQGACHRPPTPRRARRRAGREGARAGPAARVGPRRAPVNEPAPRARLDQTSTCFRRSAAQTSPSSRTPRRRAAVRYATAPAPMGPKARRSCAPIPGPATEASSARCAPQAASARPAEQAPTRKRWRRSPEPPKPPWRRRQAAASTAKFAQAARDVPMATPR